jgi:divalent metal cation (Fe/Co/Zn/Cd) transporter
MLVRMETLDGRSLWLRRGLALERVTIGWNAAEAAVALGAGWVAGSIALVGFGLDSVIETIAGFAVYRRLGAELRGADREIAETHERRALRVVGVTFFLLAAYVVYEATSLLRQREAPAESPVGIALAVISLSAMPLLGAAKLRVGRALGSRALVADAKETLVCAYLSLALLAGLTLNAVVGWWWTDPVAALLMVPLLLREGFEALRGERCR